MNTSQNTAVTAVKRLAIREVKPSRFTIIQRSVMADKDKYSFIVVKYPRKTTADEALKAVLGLAKEKKVNCAMPS